MSIFKTLTEKRRTGNFGEDAAVRYLKKKGFKILERNYVAFGHEADIIARHKDVTVFIEVKTRSTERLLKGESRPAAAVTPKKQRSIAAAAKVFLALHRPEGRSRFDVVEVLTEGEGKSRRVSKINHIESAFTLTTAYNIH